jgi:hypothetical protein
MQRSPTNIFAKLGEPSMKQRGYFPDARSLAAHVFACSHFSAFSFVQYLFLVKHFSVLETRLNSKKKSKITVRRVFPRQIDSNNNSDS